MSHISIEHIVSKQRSFFSTGITKSVDFRIAQLKKMRQLLKDYKKEILKALHDDLKKPTLDAYFSEIYLAINEINYASKYLHRWIKPIRVKTPIYLWPMRSALIAQPHGIVLIIASWNYPFNLSLVPLVGAIAAGDCAIIKPSYRASASQILLAQLINDSFASEYLYVVEGKEDVLEHTLNQKFDYIFFSGGTDLAKHVMHKAAQFLTPVTLELGGKSTCIVDKTASLDKAAKKIVWAKWLNAGQSCIAPDYLLVHAHIKSALIAKIKQEIITMYGTNPEQSEAYGRIIDKDHVSKLEYLMKDAHIIYGGQSNQKLRYVGPTLIDIKHMDHPLMKEEIFGPLLPIVTFETYNAALDILHHHPTPLALYLFCHDKTLIRSIMQATSSGSYGINELIFQACNPSLPFGGVGTSGMGRYHGKASFDTFSYYRSIIKEGWFDVPFRYPNHLNMQQILYKVLNFFS